MDLIIITIIGPLKVQLWRYDYKVQYGNYLKVITRYTYIMYQNIYFSKVRNIYNPLNTYLKQKINQIFESSKVFMSDDNYFLFTWIIKYFR